ncbi:PepSY domain-containing protein [Alteromonas sp. ASW11-36]|uniref:PepSY domain-containing protein n=1 Tax=Alteromonas arenosi TaxID=3055817 RepID=A0ABT7STC2_9ALTE|nr:PepSY domain-containing protein [Alteromonas sp. ASW11-36]MDM7859400.1 PepSY domain-containing protein [Alteromonas sp. ASW11-36]
MSRKLHLWLALAIFLPALIVFGSGILLQVKKQSDWVQPPTISGIGNQPELSFLRIYTITAGIPELEVSDWQDIKRIDVRPDKGMLKVVAENHWEAQIDTQTGDILQVAYRRSDIIESIHDGSWFADFAKLWVFLPAGIFLFVMWGSGLVLLYTTLKSKRNKVRVRQLRD